MPVTEVIVADGCTRVYSKKWIILSAEFGDFAGRKPDGVAVCETCAIG